MMLPQNSLDLLHTVEKPGIDRFHPKMPASLFTIVKATRYAIEHIAFEIAGP